METVTYFILGGLEITVDGKCSHEIKRHLFLGRKAMTKLVQFSSIQLISFVRIFLAPGIAACQASVSITNSRSLRKLMSIESVMPSIHLILCRPLLLPSSIFLSIRVFSNESALRIRWPKYDQTR